MALGNSVTLVLIKSGVENFEQAGPWGLACYLVPER